MHKTHNRLVGFSSQCFKRPRNLINNNRNFNAAGVKKKANNAFHTVAQRRLNNGALQGYPSSHFARDVIERVPKEIAADDWFYDPAVFGADPIETPQCWRRF